MQNQNSKHIQEHRKRKIAAFNELAGSWIPKEYLARDPSLASAPVKLVAYFMILDWAMSTGNVDELTRLIGYLSASLETMTRFGDGTAHN